MTPHVDEIVKRIRDLADSIESGRLFVDEWLWTVDLFHGDELRIHTVHYDIEESAA